VVCQQKSEKQQILLDNRGYSEYHCRKATVEEVTHMTSHNGKALTVQPMDVETIQTLASFPREKQALVKGFILGLGSKEPKAPPPASERPSA